MPLGGGVRRESEDKRGARGWERKINKEVKSRGVRRILPTLIEYASISKWEYREG